jgi:hypothetical protein
MNDLEEIAEAQQKVDFHAKMLDVYKRHLENLKSVFGQSSGNGKSPPRQRRSRKAAETPQRSVPVAAPLFSESNQPDNVQFILDAIKRSGKEGTSQQEIQDAFDKANITLSRNYVSNTVNRLARVKSPQIRIEGSRKRARIFWAESENTNGQ